MEAWAPIEIESKSETQYLPPVEVIEAAAPGQPLDRFWVAVRRIPSYIRLAANMARDGDVPKSAKALLAVGGVYTVSPIDLVPGVIPVAGQLDDLMVLLLTLRSAVRRCPSELATGHLERAGLGASDFDDDMNAVKETAKWLAGKGYRASRSLAMRGGRMVATLWRDHVRTR